MLIELAVIVDSHDWVLIRDEVIARCHARQCEPEEQTAKVKQEARVREAQAKSDRQARIKTEPKQEQQEPRVKQERSSERRSREERRRSYFALDLQVVISLLLAAEDSIEQLRKQIAGNKTKIERLQQQIRRVFPKWTKVKSMHRKRKPKQGPIDGLHKGKG